MRWSNLILIQSIHLIQKKSFVKSVIRRLILSWNKVRMHEFDCGHEESAEISSVVVSNQIPIHLVSGTLGSHYVMTRATRQIAIILVAN